MRQMTQIGARHTTDLDRRLRRLNRRLHGLKE
jgi:hypothetical protein